MPIKNYTTKVPASRSISEIQNALAEHGAVGVAYKYERNTGRVEALNFGLEVNGEVLSFSLPVNWRKFQKVLESQSVRRWEEEDYVYRVAWRNIRDWVLSQLAFYETEIVDFPQVFLPFVQDKNGKTLYDSVLSGQLSLKQ